MPTVPHRALPDFTVRVNGAVGSFAPEKDAGSNGWCCNPNRDVASPKKTVADGDCTGLSLPERLGLEESLPRDAPDATVRRQHKLCREQGEGDDVGSHLESALQHDLEKRLHVPTIAHLGSVPTIAIV